MKTYLFPWALIVLMSISSCVKDIDIDQLDGVTINPEIELSFIYAQLDPNDYLNQEIAIDNLTISDTINLSALNSDFVRDDIKRAEFFFKFTNSITSDFLIELKFLNDNNSPKYQISMPIDQGSLNDAIVQDYFIPLDHGDIRKITKASKVVINFNMSSSPDNLEGLLELQSKAIYFLEL